MSNEKLSSVTIYLQSHRDVVQSDFTPIARLEMGMLPTKGDMIDVTPYLFLGIHHLYNNYEQALRVDSVFIDYRKHEGVAHEVVYVCVTAIPRPRFLR